MAYHTWQATERVRTEARLLVDAFLNRGRIRFQDREPPDVVGRSRDKGGGAGGGPGLIAFRDKPVPGSHLVSEVRVMTRVGEGVVGLQLVMLAGSRTSELPVHGAAAGENRSTRAHAFAVDAPVERLSRFECDHNDGLIERLRVVTSGGRRSPWFGEKLTALPHAASLPDWGRHSLAAATATAALAARKAAAAAALASLEQVSSAEKIAAAAAAAEAEAVAARAPEWDVQKEYITGLVGIRTHERLVGLGVITRHVTSSHIFSYLWEAPEEDERTKAAKVAEAGGDGSQSGLSTSGKSRSNASSLASGGGSTGAAGDAEGSLTSTPSQPKSSLPPTTAGESGASSGGGWSGGGGSGEGGGEGASRNPTDSAASSGGSTTLSRAEAKQQRFAQEMKDRERQKEERARLAREKEEEMARLISGVNPSEDDDGDEDGGASSRDSSYAPAPQKEFSSMLRMRQTDARRALERSVTLAHSARTYRGSAANGFDDAGGALSSLPVVAGLTNWLHKALLPRLVPLPVLAESTTDLFARGERMLAAARATRARGARVRHAADRMAEARRRRGRRGVMSPVQRAKEIRDREVGLGGREGGRNSGITAANGGVGEKHCSV